MLLLCSMTPGTLTETLSIFHSPTWHLAIELSCMHESGSMATVSARQHRDYYYYFEKGPPYPSSLAVA